MDDLRDALNSALSGDQNEATPEVNTQETSTEPDESSTTQTSEKQQVTSYEIGGRKFNSWADAKKWGDNFSSMYGKTTNELSATKQRLQELESGETAKWMSDLKQHPELADMIRNAYKDYNQKLASGATKKEAAKESGVNQLPQEIQDLIKWKQTVTQEIEAEQTSEAIDNELKELKSIAPKISEETLAATYELASKHLTLSLSDAYKLIMSEINAKRAATVKDTGVPGKFATAKGSSKKQDLTDPNQAKKNIMDILGE